MVFINVVGIILINTGRGELLKTDDAIEYLKNGKIGGLGMDVYENEKKLFFNDLSNQIVDDDLLAKLLHLPNVLLTGHQAFLTYDALEQIATVSFNNAIEII